MYDIVKVDNLTKDYGHLIALKGVSFSIRRAECFGLLGPNGAGKTTLMKIINCNLPQTSGTVNIFGMDSREWPSEIKARQGVMPQEESLDPDLNVLENLMVYARYFDISKDISSRKSLRLLDFVGLSDKSGVKITKLSGGMKRRLLLARALINGPELLILDEPTTGMDPHSRMAVWRNLGELKQKNTTLLLSTHYMEEAQNMCDRVAVMDEGVIIEVDSPAALMQRHGGNLQDVYVKLTGKALKDWANIEL